MAIKVIFYPKCDEPCTYIHKIGADVSIITVIAPFIVNTDVMIFDPISIIGVKIIFNVIVFKYLVGSSMLF